MIVIFLIRDEEIDASGAHLFGKFIVAQELIVSRLVFNQVINIEAIVVGRWISPPQPGVNRIGRAISVARPIASSIAFNPAISRILNFVRPAL